MARFFTMRLVAPMATIRGPVVGDNVAAQPIPAPSLPVGIIGAALGLDRREGEELNRIQDAMEVAYLIHREPNIISEFQTTDMSKPHMVGPMWAHDGERAWVVERGGNKKDRNLVSLRDITCDVDMTAVVSWSLKSPSVEDVLRALTQPKMVLTIGSRWAFPSKPIAGRILEAKTLAAALVEARGDAKVVRAYVPTGFSPPKDALIVSIATRDFKTRQFGGSVLYAVQS